MGTWSLFWGQSYWGLALTTHPFLFRRYLWVSYTSAFPLCLLGIFVTFHLLITVTSILQNSCMFKKTIYVFHVFRVRYEYTNIYAVVNSLYVPNCFAKAIKLHPLTRITKGGRECITFWSCRKFIFVCIPVLVNITCSMRRHAFYKICCVTGCDHQQFTPV